jgi:hypothetical protein
MHLGDCKPLQCETAMTCIEGVRDPLVTPVQMGVLRAELRDCTPCLAAFDLEVKLRATMIPTSSELPTVDFCLRITETLASIDLSQLDITDF